MTNVATRPKSNKAVAVALARIRTDGGTQLRSELNAEAVEDYADAYRSGDALPPVVAFDDGDNLWLADGFHRVAGAERAGRTSVKAEVRTGTRRDAILFAAGCNAQHGLRRTTGDKSIAVNTLLADPEWSACSDRWIAERCRVSPTFVGKVRRATVNVDSRDRVGKDGRVIDTTNIGRRQQSETLPPVPLPPLEVGKTYVWEADDYAPRPEPVAFRMEITPAATEGFWAHAREFTAAPLDGDSPAFIDYCLRGQKLGNPEAWAVLTRDLVRAGEWQEIDRTELDNDKLALFPEISDGSPDPTVFEAEQEAEKLGKPRRRRAGVHAAA